MNDEIKKWLEEVRAAGLNNDQITTQLKARGYTDGQISNLLNPKVVDMENNENKLRGKELLESDSKLQLFQKIILGWLGAILILRLVIGLMVNTALDGVSSVFLIGFWVVYFLTGILPGLIVLIGIIKVKVWAYFLYMLALFFVIIPTNLPEDTLPFILTIIQSIGSLVIFILTLKLYNKLFPSRKSFQRFKDK